MLANLEAQKPTCAIENPLSSPIGIPEEASESFGRLLIVLERLGSPKLIQTHDFESLLDAITLEGRIWNQCDVPEKALKGFVRLVFALGRLG